MSTLPTQYLSNYVHCRPANSMYPLNSSLFKTDANLKVFSTNIQGHAGYPYSHTKHHSISTPNAWAHEAEDRSSLASQTPSPIQPSEASEDDEGGDDVSPQMPAIDLPRTPDWFPSPLPPPQGPVRNPPAPHQSIQHALDQGRNLPQSLSIPPLSTATCPASPKFVFSPHAPVFRMQPREIMPRGAGIVEAKQPTTQSPLTQSGKPSSGKDKGNLTPAEMQQILELYVQGLPKAKLLEISNAGQLCHLKRPERVGVFLQSTVKFDKAFKHLAMLGNHLQHLIIGTKEPIVAEVQDIRDEAIVNLLPTIPNLVELRLQGFILLTQASFIAALTCCRDLQILVITGTRDYSPSRLKVFYPNRGLEVGGYGSLEADTLAALLPPFIGGPLPARRLRLVDIAYQATDIEIAMRVTAIRGELVIMRELAYSTERYASGRRDTSYPVNCLNLQGNFKTMKPVTLPFPPSVKSSPSMVSPTSFITEDVGDVRFNHFNL